MTMIPAKNAVDLGIVVRDLQASIAFYVDLLGLERLESVDSPLGRMERLRFGASFVKLIQPAVPVSAGAPGIVASLGFRYVTFLITNMADVHKACMAAGVPFEADLREPRPGLLLFMVRDPDGNVVELLSSAA
jgi:catechol 2,3-dioxygenase-like lactoylglutathione lyase family enzyme